MTTAIKNKLVTAQESHVIPPITVNPRRLSGQAVIATSRVPLTALLDHINVAAFCDDFDTITPEQAQAAIDYLKELAEDGTLGEAVNF
jgi:uncharacterized protein (DUF433 family)